MKRAVAILCGGLLLVGGGCAGRIGNTVVEADVRIDEKSLDVTLDEAAAKLQMELQRRGLQVTVNPDGNTIRVVTRTRSGDQFTMVLTRSIGASGKEQTKVRVEWDAKPDVELWLELLAALAPVALQAAH
jgi:hypothetical protein